jgi:hypothetical protein
MKKEKKKKARETIVMLFAEFSLIFLAPKSFCDLQNEAVNGC